MPEATPTPTGTAIDLEFVLAGSESYIETLSIKSIQAQPWLVELVIRTQLLSAKNPAEKRVKSRTCIHRDKLTELQLLLGQCVGH